MAFTKLPNFTKKITDLPDIPSPAYTAAQLKEQFQAPSNELKEAHNKLIDELAAETGASNVGAKKADGTGATLQVAIDEKATNTRVQQAEGRITNAESRLTNTENVANTANNKANSVQTQVNNLIIESGTSDAEVIQARGNAPVLNERLNNVDSLLTQNETDLINRGYNIQWSALEAVNGDWTNAIQKALDTYNHIFIPGVYNVYGTIEVTSFKSIEFANGASLVKPADATNNEPVIWIRGIQSSVIGAGMRNSNIKSEKPSPLGVVCIGYKGVTDLTARSVLYNTVRDIGIIGKTNGGETSGLPSYVLYLCNNELSGLPSYFHTLQNLFLANGNVGLMFEGWANANIVNNIQLYQVGNEKRLDGAGIKFKNTDNKSPLDNIIANVFHHASSNAITLYFDGNIGYNSLNNIVAEQGGASAVFIKNNDDNASQNIISGIDNVASGSQFTPNFRKKNTVILRSSMNAETLTSKNGNIEIVNTGKGTKNQHGSFSVGLLTENTGYELLKINVANARRSSFLVELGASFNTTNALPVMWKTGKIVFAVVVSETGVVTVTNISQVANGAIFITPIVNGNDISFGIKTPNNGTSTTTTTVYVDYKVFGFFNLTVNEITTPTILPSVSLIPLG